MPFILDTNILIHIARNSDVWAHVRKSYFPTGLKGNASISAVTIGETRSFARRNRWGDDRIKRLLQVLKTIEALKILDDDVQDAYVNIDTYSQNKHKSLTLPKKFPVRNMGKNDVWIAATACAKNTTLLSTDKDFEHLHGVFLNFIYIDVDDIRNSLAK